MKKEEDILKVHLLSVAFNGNETIHSVSFPVKPNTILGIVGESGSGKSVTSMAIMGLLPKVGKITSGTIIFQDKELHNFSEKEFQSIRGKEIAMVFQEPMSALNPTMKCGKQVEEILKKHTSLSKDKIKKEVLSLFKKVKLPDIERVYDSYPHELSGGQKQRIVIAIAIACKPKLLIADEPTTALDVTVQKEIIELIKSLQSEMQMSVLFISHDLNLVSQIADNTLVMYKGKIVEQQPTQQLFQNPKDSYTKSLIELRPNEEVRLKRLPTIFDIINNNKVDKVISVEERKENHKKIYSKAPLLEIKNLSKSFFTEVSWFSKKETKAVNDVSFSIYEGETLGLVGESGCGKSTIGNLILNLTDASSGKILYKGKDITKLSRSERKLLRKEIQLIFQDPFASLNPKLSIGKAIMEPMKAHGLYKDNTERKQKAIELLERIGLESEHFNRYPHEFSGGQRQRIGIARTIALKPRLIICDESVSALDISVQSQVLNLLNELKDVFGFTYIFISHDLSVVKYMADQLLVMKSGKIIEKGEPDAMYSNPKEEYTKQLIGAIPAPKF